MRYLAVILFLIGVLGCKKKQDPPKKEYLITALGDEYFKLMIDGVVKDTSGPIQFYQHSGQKIYVYNRVKYHDPVDFYDKIYLEADITEKGTTQTKKLYIQDSIPESGYLEAQIDYILP